jgi:hypothetical protein
MNSGTRSKIYAPENLLCRGGLLNFPATVMSSVRVRVRWASVALAEAFGSCLFCSTINRGAHYIIYSILVSVSS